ncbi:hypothetical protein QE152_g34144 [Popillia japonica]|uniref:Uncharacterized protein n=1 Tax=Popillia japonica TaxID=7064 RepID=A0AAW1IU34_POPJA
MKYLFKIKLWYLVMILSLISWKCESTLQDLTNQLSIDYKYVDFEIAPNEPMWWKRGTHKLKTQKLGTVKP